ncbi:DUF3341 domain-containing protein [Saprospira sp. CCB-QB6]|uniref:DUF3341 domain-containing protein n=1 Tax=Saprospira sp. CCB-QB6 TaxID=3023936 RepID=UPI0023498A18|nr:DUF3341 domain-containing protein [Saprospira sp. CCB-QB6]WCL82554.1 DUF3341 domain-containing protein [Saprospira sp. CCB-QB6]
MKQLNKTILYGLYTDEEVLMDAVRDIREEGNEIWDVFTPFPVHGLDPVLGLKESRLHIAGFVYGLFGALTAFGFMTWTLTRDWPIIFGGKPYFSGPSFIPITFEFTVLMAAVGMVITFYLVCGLGPGVSNPYLDPRITDDHFCIAFDVTNMSEEERQALEAKLLSTGACEQPKIKNI